MRKTLVFIFLVSIIISSCKREYGPYYDPPKGQQPVLYVQLAADPQFSTFVSAIDMVPGLKAELSSSGLFTIMAPDNAAFTSFFNSHPTYKSLDVIPADTLALIVKYHIMKWMLFKINFNFPGLTKDNFTAYKYESRASLTYSELLYGGSRKNIYYPSKILQVYAPNFFTLYHVTAQDYTDVYGSGSSVSTETQLNVMGASVTKADIASGNGVIHKIDHVLIPPPTIAQLLDNNSEYSDFNQLMKGHFITYAFNSSATIAQGNNGDINSDGLVDSLWTRNYTINSNLDNENPKQADGKSALTMTAFVPSKSAFLNYLNNKLAVGFKNLVDSIPVRTLTLFYQSQFSNNMYWPSNLDAGNTVTLNGDKINISRGDINKTLMASNGIFYEMNKIIEPAAFTSVTGPALLSLKYWYFGEMLLRTSSISGLTRAGTAYTILAPTNEAFQNYGIYYDPAPPVGTAGFFRVIPPSTTSSALSTVALGQLVGNHIIINASLPAAGITDGFYPTLNSSIIAVEGGNIHGSVRDTIPQITDPDHLMSNGYFHGINRVILNPQNSLYDKINSTSLYDATTIPLVTTEYTKFRELVVAAGCLNKDFAGVAPDNLPITGVDANKKLTLFVPSNDAITAAQIAGILPNTGAVTPNEPVTTTDPIGVIVDLTKRARLVSYIRYFFVQDQQALTDGKVIGTFLTSRFDPSSTPTDKVYVKAILTYPGSILTYKENGGAGTTGKVVMTDPVNTPQNTMAKDGIIQIIDNAFTSKY